MYQTAFLGYEIESNAIIFLLGEIMELFAGNEISTYTSKKNDELK